MITGSDRIIIQEKPDWVSWDTIHDVLWAAHACNREKGIYMSYPALPGDQIREMIEGRGKMFVAIDKGKVVGTAALIKKNYTFWCGKGDYAYLCLGSVLPEYNGCGLYKRLCAIRAEYANDMGLNRFVLETHEHNYKMIKMKEKVGYLPINLKVGREQYYIVLAKWIDNPPYSKIYCEIQFILRKYYKKLRFKPGRIKRFGI